MPNQPKGRTYAAADGDGDEAQTKKDSPAKPRTTAAVQQKQEKTSSTGWFGGIWSKLAPKPKNQMKLPDDKNPTVCTGFFFVCYDKGKVLLFITDCLGFRKKALDQSRGIIQ